MTIPSGEFNNVSAFKRSLYWCQALRITNKDRYQSTGARRALTLLNSPQMTFLDWSPLKVKLPTQASFK